MQSLPGDPTLDMHYHADGSLHDADDGLDPLAFVPRVCLPPRILRFGTMQPEDVGKIEETVKSTLKLRLIKASERIRGAKRPCVAGNIPSGVLSP